MCTWSTTALTDATARHGSPFFDHQVPSKLYVAAVLLPVQEAKVALVRLYQHQTYKLLPGQEPLAVQQNLTLSPKYGVKVHVVPRA